MTTAKLPPTFTIKGKIYGRVYDDTPDEVYLVFSPWEQTKEYFLVKEVEVEVGLPRAAKEPVVLQVEALRASIDAIRAEAQAQITKVEGELNRLLQLTYVEASK